MTNCAIVVVAVVGPKVCANVFDFFLFVCFQFSSPSPSLFCLFLHASRWKQFNLTALVADESVVLCTHRLYVGTPQSRPDWHCDKNIKANTRTQTHTHRVRHLLCCSVWEIGYKDCHNPLDAIKFYIITIILSVWAGNWIYLIYLSV